MVKKTYLTLARAQEMLGPNTVICLESHASLEQKFDQGEEKELWHLDPATGRIRREDGKFCTLGIIDRGGYFAPEVYEEPNVHMIEYGYGDMRVVGHVIVEVNQDGLVRVRKAKGLNGEILELKPSSISKDELAASGERVNGYFEANPQRLNGMIAVYCIKTDFPAEEGMTPTEFRKKSTDGCSLSALAKAGL